MTIIIIIKVLGGDPGRGGGGDGQHRARAHLRHHP